MLACEKFNEVSRQKEAPIGLVVLLVSSLLQGGGVIPGSPLEQTQSAEAATLDDSSGKTNNQVAKIRPKLQRQKNSRESAHKVIRGQASWYGPGFHGKKTASGEIFDQGKLTAAHKTIPLGTKAKVTNLQNGNTVEVEINDRGPYIGQREIDVSHAAANALGFVKSGLTLVRIELLPEESGREEAG